MFFFCGDTFPFKAFYKTPKRVLLKKIPTPKGEAKKKRPNCRRIPKLVRIPEKERRAAKREKMVAKMVERMGGEALKERERKAKMDGEAKMVVRTVGVARMVKMERTEKERKGRKARMEKEMVRSERGREAKMVERKEMKREKAMALLIHSLCLPCCLTLHLVYVSV